MKCKIRLTRTVELFVEGESEEAIVDWMSGITPEGAYLAAKGAASDDYSEEILCYVDDDSIVDYVIKKDN